MRYTVEELQANQSAGGYVNMVRDWIVKSGRANGGG